MTHIKKFNSIFKNVSENIHKDNVLKEGKKYNYDVVIFRANSDYEIKKILDFLYKNGYRWYSGTDYIPTGMNFPYYFWINSNKIIQHLVDMSDYDVYYNIKQSKNSKIPNRIFNTNDINYLDNIFHYGFTKPSYKPKIISRLDENISPNVYIFECKDEEEFVLLQNKLFSIDYRWITGEKTIYKLNEELYEGVDEPPIYIFSSVKDKRFFYSSSNKLELYSYDLIENLKHTIITRPVNFADNRNNIDSNLYSIKDFSRLIRFLNPILRPSYKPKVINKELFEDRNNLDDANEIFVQVNNAEEYQKMIDLQDKFDFFGSSPDYTNAIYPLYLFYDLERGQKSFLDKEDKMYIDDIESHSFLDGVYNKKFTIKDYNIIKKMFEEKKINITPSYKPRKIYRLNESLNNYRSIAFRANNFEETEIILDKLFDLGWVWVGGEGRRKMDFFSYPYYILATDKKIIYHIIIRDNQYDIYELLKKLNRTGFDGTVTWYFPPEIYGVNDVDNIKSLFYKKPSYKPKKITR